MWRFYSESCKNFTIQQQQYSQHNCQNLSQNKLRQASYKKNYTSICNIQRKFILKQSNKNSEGPLDENNYDEDYNVYLHEGSIQYQTKLQQEIKKFSISEEKLAGNPDIWPDKSDMYLVRKDGNLCYREIVKGTNSLSLAFPSSQQYVLVWRKKPKTCLLLKKPGECWEETLNLVRHLHDDQNMNIVLEPSVYNIVLQQTKNHQNIFTFHEFTSLIQIVDFIICLGGDGVILHAAHLFNGGMPPIMAFHLGSLGFLTNHDYKNHRDSIQDLLYGSIPLEDCNLIWRNGSIMSASENSSSQGLDRRLTSKGNQSSVPISNGNANRENGRSKSSQNGAISKQNTGKANMERDYEGKDAERDYSSLERNFYNQFRSHQAQSYYGAVTDDLQRDEQVNGVMITLRMRLKCEILRDGNVEEKYEVLNEVVVDRGQSSFLTQIECYINGEQQALVQADGIMLSTPTGSTAYNVAAGGSMVHCSVSCILFTPICPHSLSLKPVVLPDYVEIILKNPARARGDLWVSFDGKQRKPMRRGDILRVSMSKNPVPTINSKDSTTDFFKALQRCFNWNVRVEQGALPSEKEKV